MTSQQNPDTPTSTTPSGDPTTRSGGATSSGAAGGGDLMDELREGVSGALREARWPDGSPVDVLTSRTIRDYLTPAVLAVVGPELDRLRAEVERLSSGRVSNAEKERDDALALIERMSSLDGAADDAGPANAWPANPGEFAARWNALDDGARARWLGEAVEAMSSIDAMTWRAEAAEAEVAQLRAALVKVRVAVELVVQDVRAQRGDHIAGLVEDSFAAHMALASVPAVDAGEVAGPCRSGCGPGYRYGDEGCRHTPAAVDAGDREPASEGGA